MYNLDLLLPQMTPTLIQATAPHSL
jgi:hypothetical protein